MLERQGNVLGGGAPGQQREILENEGDRVEALRRDGAGERDAAAGRREEPAEDSEQRALAASGRADDGEHLARGNPKRDVVEHLQGSEGVAHVLDEEFHRGTSITRCHRPRMRATQ